MKFEIKSSMWHTDVDELLENYPCLLDYGYCTEHQYLNTIPCIEIDSLEDLIRLGKEIEWPLIVEENSIEIYDGYRE